MYYPQQPQQQQFYPQQPQQQPQYYAPQQQQAQQQYYGQPAVAQQPPQQQQYYAPQQQPQQQQYYAPQQQAQQYYPEQQQQQYYPPQQQQQYYPPQQQYSTQSFEQVMPAPNPIVNTTRTRVSSDSVQNYAPGTTQAIGDAGTWHGGYEILRHTVTAPEPQKSAGAAPKEGTVLGRTVTVNDAMQKLLDQMDLQMKMQADFEKKQQAWAKKLHEPVVESPTTTQEMPRAAVNTKVRIEEVAATQNFARAFVSEMKAQTNGADDSHSHSHSHRTSSAHRHK